MRDNITIQLAPGWTTITPQELPPGIINIEDETIRYLAAAVPETPAYAPNLVIVCTLLSPGDDPEEVLIGSARVMAETIPGMRMIDELSITGAPEGRRLRSNIYIFEDFALTIFQIAWLDRSPEGINLWTATFTCTTREFGVFLEQFIAMSDTLEVAA